MARVTIELYTPDKRHELEELLKEFSKEVFGYGDADVDSFVKSHWAIYIAYDKDEAVGFLSAVYNSYFQLRPPTIGCTYLYVKPNHRNSRVNYLLSIQLGILCVDNNLPLENYYATEQSAKIDRKMKGTKLYTAVLYPVEEVKNLFSHLTDKVKITRTK